MARLVLVNGDEAGRAYPLVAERELVLGRQEDCDIVIDNVPGISRRHARVHRGGEGQWLIEDLGSQNGVYCNGERVASRAMADSEVFWLSNAAFRFEANNDAGAPPVEAPPVEAPAGDGAAAEITMLAPPEAVGEKTVVTDRPTEADAPAAEVEAPAAPDVAPAALPASETAGVPLPPPPPPAPPAAPGAPAGMDLIDAEQVRTVGAARDRIIEQFSQVIVGQREVLQQLLIALLSSGHCLMIGLPGLAKTLMVSTLAQILELRFKRIQFTPDLMPSDIVGSDVLDVDEDTGRKSFRFIHGPIFTNMLLADEINRTPPKTQAALLEAMQERQVTAANQRFPLPAPFFVLATQNPLEQEGTYPLPEAQLDRFMFNIMVDYPAEEEEELIVKETTRKRTVKVDKVLSAQELLGLQDVVRQLPVSDHVIKYATRLVRASRPKDQHAPDYIREHVSCGAGPRAAQFLILGAKARAVLDGRLNVSADDVRALALPVLRHRLFTSFTADSEGITPDDLVKRLLLNVPEPSPRDY